jgi:hypothetical protein
VDAAAPAHSDDFVRAARAEADRLRLEAQRLREEAARHHALAEGATAEAIVLESRVRELDELLGRAPQLRLDLQPEALRGQRLRETAIEIIGKHRRLGEPIHYREWFELLLAEGHSVEGKDPLATFLTQVTRSPVVLRQPRQPGVYRVDPQTGGEETLRALERARQRLLALRQELEQARAQGDEPRADGLRKQHAAAARDVAAGQRALSEVARVQATLSALAS